jgi:hypothetical protein
MDNLMTPEARRVARRAHLKVLAAEFNGAPVVPVVTAEITTVPQPDQSQAIAEFLLESRRQGDVLNSLVSQLKEILVERQTIIKDNETVRASLAHAIEAAKDRYVHDISNGRESIEPKDTDVERHAVLSPDFEDIPLSDMLPGTGLTVTGRPVPSAPPMDNAPEDVDDALGWFAKWRLTSSKKEFKAQLSKVCDLEDKMDYEERTHRLAGTTDQVGTDKRRREYDAEKLKLSDLRMACINVHKKYVPHLTLEEIECKMHA